MPLSRPDLSQPSRSGRQKETGAAGTAYQMGLTPIRDVVGYCNAGGGTGIQPTQDGVAGAVRWPLWLC